MPGFLNYQFCGTGSEDFNTCSFCRKRLPEEKKVRIILYQIIVRYRVRNNPLPEDSKVRNNPLPEDSKVRNNPLPEDKRKE